MFELMYAANGIGLAANQVDLPLRIFVMDVAEDDEKRDPVALLNPVVRRPKGSEEKDEGCLSLPGVYGPVVRPKQVQIEAYTIDGRRYEQELTGMLARCALHEIDHLDGVLFPDRMNPMAAQKLMAQLADFEAEFESRRRLGEIGDDESLEKQVREWEAAYA